MRSVRIITMVGISPFYLFCTVLVVCFSDLVISSNETKTIVSNKLDADIQFEKIYQYSIKQELLTNGYDLQPPINYKLKENSTLILVPIETFCKRTKEIDICKKFQVLKENQTNSIIKVRTLDDLREKITDDTTIAFTLKVVNNQNSEIIYGETIILVNIKGPRIDNTLFGFEKSSYTINVAYGRKGTVYKFTACFRNASQHMDSKCTDQKNVTYTFAHNYTPSSDYSKNLHFNYLSIDNLSGNLAIDNYIKEGYYEFVIEATYNGTENHIIAHTMVTLFIDNVAVCEKDDINFQIAYRKFYVDENMRSRIFINNTKHEKNCALEISKCHPDAALRNFIINNGELKIKEELDRESAMFYDDPNIFLKLSCRKNSNDNDMQFPQWFEYMPYDPHYTVIQIVINDLNDNPPTFPDEHIVVGYPVTEVALDVLPEHLVQVKATDNDFGENANITYSLKSNDMNDFLIDPVTGIIYCNNLVDSGGVVKEFTVIANNSVKDPNGEDMKSELLVTVKYLTYEHIIKVYIKFNVEEYIEILERQLSDITGWKISSLSNEIINGEDERGGIKLERTMIVYGIDNETLVHGSDLEKKLNHNEKILRIQTYYQQTDQSQPKPNTTKPNPMTEEPKRTSVLFTLMVCIAISAAALGVLFYGFIKNGRYMMFISSLATTPLKDDMENMSQSNWITTFDRANLSPQPSSRINSSRKNGQSTSRSNDQYFSDVDHLEPKPAYEDDLFSFDKIEDDNNTNNDSNFADFSHMR